MYKVYNVSTNEHNYKYIFIFVNKTTTACGVYRTKSIVRKNIPTIERAKRAENLRNLHTFRSIKVCRSKYYSQTVEIENPF